MGLFCEHPPLQLTPFGLLLIICELPLVLLHAFFTAAWKQGQDDGFAAQVVDPAFAAKAPLINSSEERHHANTGNTQPRLSR
jgi:hypothetical protein